MLEKRSFAFKKLMVLTSFLPSGTLMFIINTSKALNYMNKTLIEYISFETVFARERSKQNNQIKPIHLIMIERRILLVSILSFLILLVAPECENGCSGHGQCTVYDMCLCYRNWQANDCSERKY